MLMYAIVDPEILDDAFFSDKSYKIQTQSFWKGVLKNVLILVDKENILLKELVTKTDALSTGKHLRLQKYLEEILMKYRHKRFVVIGGIGLQKNTDIHATQTIMIKNTLPYDAYITYHGNSDHPKSLDLHQYDESKFEEKREEYYEGFVLQHYKPENEIAAHIKRLFRYTSKISFLDPQISRANNVGNFYKGLRFLIQLLTECSKCCSRVEVITRILPRDKNEFQQNHFEQLFDDLISPLSKEFSDIKFRLTVKEDRRNDFHSRWLVTDHVNVSVERGFDLFDRNHFRQNFFRIDSTGGSSKHINNCRKLPNVWVRDIN